MLVTKPAFITSGWTSSFSDNSSISSLKHDLPYLASQASIICLSSKSYMSPIFPCFLLAERICERGFSK
ncbi:hypothetical protein CAL7102_08672 [Dulcicalothrix desertica PCC 7102]|nr:hypothetical protein CAL7102_08672 [Dulcicalothrix desertica PCC 7102]